MMPLLKNRRKACILVFLMAVVFSGCTSLSNYYHENIGYGEIVKADAHEVVFCIGKKDRVSIGNMYLVYKMEKRIGGYSRYYVKNRKAVIRVNGYVGNRWAKATVVLGIVDETCVVDI